MKFYVNTQDLNAAIQTVKSALSSRVTLTILKGIYIETQKDSLLLRCNDLSLQIDTRIPATIEEEGTIVIDGAFLSEMVRKLPDETTEFSTNKNSVSIKSGRAFTTRQCSAPDEYQSMAQTNKEYTISINQNTFKSMIRQTIYAASQEDSKPVLTGTLLELNGDIFSMVALDGYRLALRNEHVNENFSEKRAIIPSHSLLEISRILSDDDKEIKIDFSKTHVLIDLEYTTIVIRLIEGEYIKYKQILPETHETRVRLNRKELMDTIDRVALMARENKSNLMRFNFISDKLTVSANSEVGKSKEELDADIMGKDLEIAFNAKYVIDVMKNLEDDEVFMDFNNSISPCVVRPVSGDAYYYLILPVRLSSEY